MIRSLLIVALSLFAVLSSSAQLRFNELMAINTRTKADPDNKAFVDWLELYNGTNERILLDGYFLTDSKSDRFKWRFPSGAYLDPNKYMLVWMDGEDFSGSGVHAGFSLDAMGEWIGLTDLSGRYVDSVRFGRQVADHSYARSGPSLDWYYLTYPSPGGVNDDATAYRISPPPVLSRESEINGGAFSLTVTPTLPGAVIHYTMDGSVPDENSSTYSGAVSITKNTVFRAVQIADGYSEQWPASATYLFNITTKLPVISLISDPENLWDNYRGIYVDGLNGITGYCSSEPKNYNQDWERPVSFDYFDHNRQLAYSQDAGMKIFGGCSRGQSLKSLNIKADKIYGKNSFDYAFFREKPGMDKVRKFILRNSGNDFTSTMLRDPMMQALVKDNMDIDGQAYEPTVVYLNGAYWGIMNMREKIDEFYIESNYGIPSEEVNMVENLNSVVSGTSTPYVQLYNYINNNDLSVQSNYDYVAARIDIDAYIQYMWAQIYFGNTDWPGNNIRCWNTKQGDRKWRWLLYDTDFGFNLFNAPPNHNTLEFALYPYGSAWPNPSWSTLILRKLMANSGFAASFLAEAQVRMLTTFNADNVIAVIDSIEAGIAGDMPSHIARWNAPGSFSNWQYNVDYLRSFARQRPAYMIGYLGDYYAISSSFGLDVDFSPNEGVVWLNGVELKGPVSGGSLLEGTAVKLDVQAKPGYSFKEWKVTTNMIETLKMITAGAQWSYFDQGSRPAGWEQPAFDDSSWPKGSSELGYGDGDEATVTSYGGDAGNKYTTTCFRYRFNIEDPAALDSIVLSLVRDDGIVVYLNGNEILRDNMPDGTIDYGTFAVSGVGGTDESLWRDFKLTSDQLLAGENVLAAEVHQNSLSSSDISFNLSITGWIKHGTSTYTFTERDLELSVTDNLEVIAFFEENTSVPDLRINEIMAGNDSFLADEYGEYDDWFEILSMEPDPVDMAGLYLSDSKENMTLFMIPFGYPETVIQPGEFRIFWADGQNLQGPLHTAFKLSAGGEQLVLSMLSGGQQVIIDTLTFPAMDDDESWGRYQDEWLQCEVPTPGAENSLPYNAVEENISVSSHIYPNPAGDYLFVRLDQDAGMNPVSIAIFDLQGKVLLSQTGVQAEGAELTLDVSSLPEGFYVITVTGRDCRSVHKLLINR